MSTENLGIGSRINHPKFGGGVIVEVDASNYKIYFSSTGEVKTIARDFGNIEVAEKVKMDFELVSVKEIEKAVENVLQKSSDITRVYPLASKWAGGTITINPGNAEMANKVIPTATFFHKIVMVRERLRVLEQNINNHEKLDDEDRVHLHQYITRAYGSLTTFNVLFANKNDYFKGVSKD